MTPDEINAAIDVITKADALVDQLMTEAWDLNARILADQEQLAVYASNIETASAIAGQERATLSRIVPEPDWDRSMVAQAMRAWKAGSPTRQAP
jgi:hypothetical protein